MEPAPLPPPDPAPSLAERVGGWWHRPKPSRDRTGGVRLGIALAVLLPLGPVLTLGGAWWLTSREDAALAAIAASPRAAAGAASRHEAEILRGLARGGGMAATLERLARVLPTDDRIISASRTIGEADDDGLEIEVATVDPDRLRAAFRRDPALARLRGERERRGDGVLIVTLAGRP